MSPEVRQRHIDLYVNEFSFDVGRDGEAAVRELLDRGSERGLFPPVAGDPFAPYPDATNAVGSTSLVADVQRR